MTKQPSYGCRAVRYWFADGLPDIVVGLPYILCGGSFELFRLSAYGRWMNAHESLRWLELALICVASGFLMFRERRLLDVLKARITYPRAGYVQPPSLVLRFPNPVAILKILNPRPPRKNENVTDFSAETWWMFCFFVVTSSLLVMWMRPSPGERWLVLLTMPAFAIVLNLVSRRSEHPCGCLSACSLAATGPLLIGAGVPAVWDPFLASLLLGAWLVTRGVLTPSRFLHMNPYPRATEGFRA